MKGGNGMKEIWKEAVGNLLTVKSIVTLVLTLVFSVLAVTSRIDGGQYRRGTSPPRTLRYLVRQ